MGNIDRYPTYKGGKVTDVVVYANYIGLRWFYQYVVNIGRWSAYEGGQLDKFHCMIKMKTEVCCDVTSLQLLIGYLPG
jgi:hypothetical protein